MMIQYIGNCSFVNKLATPDCQKYASYIPKDETDITYDFEG